MAELKYDLPLQLGAFFYVSWSLSAHCPEVKGWAEEAWSVRHQSGIMGFESKS